MKPDFDVAAPVPIRALPMMQPIEIEAFSKITSDSKIYLEYGGGGSTSLAVAQGIPEILCVESDIGYVQSLRDCFKNSRGSVTIIHSDLGDVRPGGRPQPTQSRDINARLGQHYASAPWQLLHSENKTPDTILVDGRFRVNCALTSMLELPTGADPIFMMHDFSDERASYKAIEAFSERIDLVRKLLIFKKSPDFDPEAARKAQSQLAYDWL